PAAADGLAGIEGVAAVVTPTDPGWTAGDRIEALITASAAGGAVARERAEELVRLVVDLYGAGLERLLELLHERGALGDDVLDALAADELVASLLLVHGLHPESASTRVATAAAGMTRAGFATPDRWRDDWQRDYTRAEWLDVLPTQGLFTRLPADRLATLLAETGAALDALGGGFTMHYSALTVTAVSG
ncbi:hypothetical protein AB0H87_14775, partial [Asanoa sp. NPDC050611]